MSEDLRSVVETCIAKAPNLTAVDSALDSGTPALLPETDIERALVNTATESNLALAFAHRMKGKLLYCADLGGWLEWTGSHWNRDRTDRAYHYCVQLARSLGDSSKTVARAAFAAGVERISRAEPVFVRVLADFDQNKDLIATPDGTVDLRKGVMRQADPNDMITRCTGVSPEKGKPQNWINLLDWAFDGDAGTIRFVQEYLGYSLTGHTGAEIFVYFDGPGGNGKGCIASVMRQIGGDYFHAAPADLLTYSHQRGHPTSLAALRGKRIVLASELPVGARLDEQRLKTITGGDPLRAHLMRQDEIEFLPELKLIVAANHRPRIIRPDDAMRRRLRVIPMPKKPERPDPDLKNVLLPAEAKQIFGWLIEGAKRVLERGEQFEVPQRIADASEGYMGSQDTLGQFIDEVCNVGTDLTCPRKEIYQRYKNWADEAGERFVLNSSEFYAELELRGFKQAQVRSRDPNKRERGFRGIAVLF